MYKSLTTANQKYFNYVKTLSEKQLKYDFPRSGKSIIKIISHLYDVYWYWYQFLTTKDYSNPPDFEKMEIEELISGIKTEQNKLEDLMSSELDTSIEYRWDESDNLVQTSRQDIIMNHFLHASYHRGQLALLLRELGFDRIEETDLNPYIYQNAQFS